MSSQQTDTTTSPASTTPQDSTEETSSSAPQAPNPAQTDSTGGHEDSTPHAEQETPETEPEGEATEDPKPANAEAAKYRRRLREAEAERDALQAKLDATIDNMVSAKLENIGVPARTLRRLGGDLGTVFDDDGTFSDQRLLELVNHTFEDLGLEPSAALKAVNNTHERFGRIDWSRDPRQGYVPSAGTGGERPPKNAGWESVINP